MSGFTQYRIFIAVVEYQNLSAAAKQLHLTPSAVSKQLRNLEQQLQLPLLTKTTRRLQLTEHGQQYYSHCKSIIDQVDGMHQQLKNLHQQLEGKLSITLPEVCLYSDLMQKLRRFSQTHPQLRYHLRCTRNNEDLIANKIDFAFRLGKLEDSNLQAIALCDTRLRIVASPEYVSGNITPQQLPPSIFDLDVLLPDFMSANEAQQFLYSANPKFKPNAEHFHSVDNMNALIQTTLAGLGIGILPNITVDKFIHRKELIDLFPQYQSPTKTLHLVFVKNNSLSAKQSLFKEYIKNAFTNPS